MNLMSYRGWIIVDKDGDPQGIDDASGGYPYKAGRLSAVNFWPIESAADHYCKTINYGDKGYRVVPVKLSLDNEV